MTTSTRNRPLLYGIAGFIENEPDRYSQRVYLDVEMERVDGVHFHAWEYADRGIEFPESTELCRTQSCIAGTALMLDAPEFIIVYPATTRRPSYVSIDWPSLIAHWERDHRFESDPEYEAPEDMNDWALQGFVASRLGIDITSAQRLFHARWVPKKGLTVPEALRAIADGATVGEVSPS